MRRIWSHSCSHPYGGDGCTSACSRSFIGHTKWCTLVARARKPSFGRPWRWCRPHCTRMPSPSSWPPGYWRSGKRGPSSAPRPFSGHPQPWKGVMAIYRKCSIIIEACPSADTRCGRSYTTLIAVRRMARHLRRDSSGGRSQISLKQSYPTSRLYLSLGDENTRWL